MLRDRAVRNRRRAVSVLLATVLGLAATATAHADVPTPTATEPAVSVTASAEPTPAATSAPAPTPEPTAEPQPSPAPTSEAVPAPAPSAAPVTPAADGVADDSPVVASPGAGLAAAADRPAVGEIESVTHTPGTGYYRIHGWVADPDVSSPLTLQTWINGSTSRFGPTFVSIDRPDVAAAFPGTGLVHGFDDLIELQDEGANEVCLRVLEPLAAPGPDDPSIGCTTITRPPILPIAGKVESVTAQAGVILVRGWAVEPSGGRDVTVRVTVDGVVANAMTLAARDDVARDFPGTGAAHGFSTGVLRRELPDTRTHDVCVLAIPGTADDRGVSLGCHRVTFPGERVVGNLEVVSAVGPHVALRGWALDVANGWDPDVNIEVDGVLLPQPPMSRRTVSTSDVRFDVGRAYPGTGDHHGFHDVVRLSAGQHEVCALAAVPSRPLIRIGCRTVVVQSSPPLGALDRIQVLGTEVSVYGWAFDPDVDGAVDVHLTVNGAWGGVVRTDEVRADVAAAYPGAGTHTGFGKTFVAGLGTHQVCAHAIDPVTRQAAPLGCRTFTVTAPVNYPPLVNFESLTVSGSTVTLSGWALDWQTPGPIDVHVYVNGGWGGVVRTTGVRDDVALAYPATGNQHGFTRSFTAGPGTHQVCVYAIDPTGGAATSAGCRTVTVAGPPPNRLPIGNFESLTVSGRTVTLTGWALDPDVAGPIDVHLSVNGAWGGALRTTGVRTDVARAYPGTGDQHGFTRTFTAGPGTHQVCAHGIDPATGGSTNLGCRSVTVS